MPATAQPSPAQPSPAQPRPSPARPSPAQPVTRPHDGAGVRVDARQRLRLHDERREDGALVHHHCRGDRGRARLRANRRRRCTAGVGAGRGIAPAPATAAGVMRAVAREAPRQSSRHVPVVGLHHLRCSLQPCGGQVRCTPAAARRTGAASSEALDEGDAVRRRGRQVHQLRRLAAEAGGDGGGRKDVTAAAAPWCSAAAPASPQRPACAQATACARRQRARASVALAWSGSAGHGRRRRRRRCRRRRRTRRRPAQWRAAARRRSR